MNGVREIALTIFGMAAVTYFSRIGGLWMMNRIQHTPRLKKALEVLPGAILVSIVAPQIFATTFNELIASVITALVAWKTKNVLAATVIGIFCVWLLRNYV